MICHIKCSVKLWCWNDLPLPDDQTSPETLPLFVKVVANKHVTDWELVFGRCKTYDPHFLNDSESAADRPSEEENVAKMLTASVDIM